MSGIMVGEPAPVDECEPSGAGDARPPVALGPLGKGEHISVQETREAGVFEGHCHSGRAAVRSYGGAALAQALAAAHRGVGDDGRVVHSLHAYFLRALSPQRPVRYTVDTVRDGRSYSMRHITAVQDGKESLMMSASFKLPQGGGGWRQPDRPDVPGPEGLDNAWAFRPTDHPLRTALEYREVPRPAGPVTGEITRLAWVRTIGALPDDPALHACVLAYVSDAPLAPTALVPYGEPRPRGVTLASLDHAMWFHRPARLDEWLLYECRSRVCGDGRTLAHGEFWNRAGELVASVTQEALLHVRGTG
ncbi:acyl-CoA thioesterase II [Streptomyces sp. VRA16 Mangrove soil]|uniref:acyl-CoA thioesterase n=1 Tax=Streptomyces sp. VRA16 Mangrove soil TaxID=2817434 RepID=UPI001A9D8527|nr:acyl-CoA thioesterase domain-containing protein [Streptomyces sp. VRA16 Mangrove soil]MBO1332752.1 thioesterase family protein [Streptomyces sp. VRA16 Mangrove soil]